MVPGDFAPVDDNNPQAPLLLVVPFDAASHHLTGYLEAEASLLEVFDGERALDFLDKPAQQGEGIFLGVAEDLELVAGRIPTLQLKGVEHDARLDEAQAEMEVVRVSFAIDQADGFELDMLEFVEAAERGHLGVEALPAEQPVSRLKRAAIDRLVTGYRPGAIVAAVCCGWWSVSAALLHGRARQESSLA
ncbi:MAG: hypothetical protein AB7F89_24915 [Pirellulaceae bacterium]